MFLPREESLEFASGRGKKFQVSELEAGLISPFLQNFLTSMIKSILLLAL